MVMGAKMNKPKIVRPYPWRICPKCHFGFLRDHPEKHGWFKCGICAFSVEIEAFLDDPGKFLNGSNDEPPPPYDFGDDEH